MYYFKDLLITICGKLWHTTNVTKYDITLSWISSSKNGVMLLFDRKVGRTW